MTDVRDQVSVVFVALCARKEGKTMHRNRHFQTRDFRRGTRRKSI
jgi:hypothetical protein